MTTSKQVSDRVAITRPVRHALHVHGPEIAPALEKLLFPAGAPQNLTILGLLSALENALARYASDLLDADQNHANELADDNGYRAGRDEKIAELRNYHSSLRDVVTRNYGQAVAVAYGLAVALPEDAQALLGIAKNSSTLLRSRPLTEAPKNKSLKIDPIAAADDLDEHRNALGTALEDVEREKREAQITQTAKDAQLAKWPVIYSGVADTAAALFVLAGRPDLAERVRPTARRRAGTPEEEDNAAPQGQAPAAPEGAGQAANNG